MDDVRYGQDYQDKFDPEWYLDAYYSKDSFIMKDGSSLQFLHKLFSTMEEKPGGKLLEFGTGPSISTVLSASRVFQDITLAEYAERNREVLRKWIREEKDTHDWRPIMSYVGNLEGKSCSEIEMRTRATIKEVIACEVSDGKLELSNANGPYDFIITSLCLTAACKNVDHYKMCLKALCSYLKPGGGLILIDMIGTLPFYDVGDYKFHYMSITEKEVKNIVEQAGMNVQMFESIQPDIPGHPDYVYFSLFATKEDEHA